MASLITLAQSLGLAYLSGISLYASVAFLGWAARFGWITPPGGLLTGLTNPVIIAISTVLALIEFLATLIPGVASVWETAHTSFGHQPPRFSRSRLHGTPIHRLYLRRDSLAVALASRLTSPSWD